MSAYVVGKAHIDAILTTALRGPMVNGEADRWMTDELSWFFDGCRRYLAGDLDTAGQILLDENVVSVKYRYEDWETGGLPGPIDTSYREPYTFTVGYRLTIPELFMALDGLEYQSCEHPGWEASEAFAIVSALRSLAWRNLPGYDEAATWEVRDVA